MNNEPWSFKNDASKYKNLYFTSALKKTVALADIIR